MFTYLASILLDVCDFGFKSCLGAHALILPNLEDQILTWEDLPSIQKVRENYTHRFQASAASNRTHWSDSQTSFKARSQPSSRRRICKGYNSVRRTPPTLQMAVLMTTTALFAARMVINTRSKKKGWVCGRQWAYA